MKLAFLFLVLFSFDSMAQTNAVDPEFKKMVEGHYKDFPTINPQDAQPKIGTKTVFLDTREPKEYNVSHIKGALNYGYNKPNKELLKDIPKDAEIIVYCSIGVRSQNTGKDLRKMGFTNVKNLYGGLFLWSNQERALVDKDGKPTNDIHCYNEKWSKWVTKGAKIY